MVISSNLGEKSQRRLPVNSVIATLVWVMSCCGLVAPVVSAAELPVSAATTLESNPDAAQANARAQAAVETPDQAAATQSLDDLSADGLVDYFHQQLLQLMRNAAPFPEREQAIGPVIGDVFDLKSIARVSLGRATWKSLSAEERKTFIAMLGELVSATYASRFKEYNDQRFDIVAVDSPREGRHVVKTELVKSDGERVTLDYYLNKNKVFNVVADGVSDLSLRRADYSAVIKQDGYPALVAQIENNIADYRAGD